jgi:alcohol dehydrogenase class IV
MAKIARALGSSSASGGLFDLAESLAAPTSLKSLGVEAPSLRDVARQAVQVPYPNPQPLTESSILELLNNALTGTRPLAS